MSKLKEDQIKWVLNLDAKGVQGEVQKLSNTIRSLKDENKFLNNEMRDATKQMNAAEKEMQKLEKAGRTHSKTYQEVRGTYESAKAEVAGYKTQLEKNNKTISEHNKILDTKIKTMRVEDMTMSQLKKSAAQLQHQLNNTSAATNPKEYKQLQDELGKVQNRMEQVRGANKGLSHQMASIPGPAGGAIRALQGLGKALKALILNPVGILIMAIAAALLALKKGWDSFVGRYDEYGDTMQATNAGIKSSYDFLVDKAVDKLREFWKNFNFAERVDEYWKKVKGFFSNLREGLSEPLQTIKKLGESWENLTQRIQSLGTRVFQFFKKLVTDPKGAFELLGEKFDDIKEKVKESVKPITDLAKEAKKVYDEAAKLERQLIANTDRQREFSVESLKANLEIRKLEEIYKDVRKSDEERFAAAEKARNIELKRAEEEERLLKEKHEIIKAQNALAVSGRKDIEREQQAEKDLIAAQEKSYQVRLRVLEKLGTLEKSMDQVKLDALKKQSELQLKMLDEAKQFALDQINDTETDTAIAAVKVAATETQFAQKRLETQQAYGEALAQVEFKSAELKAKAIEESSETITEADRQVNVARTRERIEFERQAAILEKSLRIETLDDRKRTELDALKKLYDEKLISEEIYQLAKTGIEAKYEDERFNARQQWGITTMNEVFNREMDILKEQYALKLLSEEEFERAKLQIKIGFAQQYLNQVTQLTQVGANALKAIEDAQIAKAGDNEAKKLEIHKKFADANFAMQVAQIGGSLAQGIMSAWASAMTLGPIFGPIAAATVTGLLTATSIAQIASANAERRRIKALTLNGGGGSSSTTTKDPAKMGKMVLNSSAGFADGGYTGAGGKYDVAGHLPDGRPYHRGEYFVAQDEMRHPEVVPLIRRIEQVRRRRTSSNPLPDGYADGGYAASNSSSSNGISLHSVLVELTEVLTQIKEDGIEAEVNYTKFEKAKKTIENSRKNYSLG
jgi:hypothetical protein